jgi:hypothetical protein
MAIWIEFGDYLEQFWICKTLLGSSNTNENWFNGFHDFIPLFISWIRIK